MRFLVSASLLFFTLLSSAAAMAVAYGEFSVDLAQWRTQGGVGVIVGTAVISGRDAGALSIVPVVGWTSDSAVRRIPLRRWWTALRLFAVRCRVARAMVKADGDDAFLGRALSRAKVSQRLEFDSDVSCLSSAGQLPDRFSAFRNFSNDLATFCPLNGAAGDAHARLGLNQDDGTLLPAAGVTSASFSTMPTSTLSILEPIRLASHQDVGWVAVRVSATDAVGVARVRDATSEVPSLSGSRGFAGEGAALAVFKITIPYRVSGRDYLGGNKTGLGETAHTLWMVASAHRGHGGSRGDHGGAGARRSHAAGSDLRLCKYSA